MLAAEVARKRVVRDSLATSICCAPSDAHRTRGPFGAPIEWPPDPDRDLGGWGGWKRIDILARDGSLYLRRWRLFKTPLFALMLHRIVQPDEDRDLHDHPWSFASLVVWGAYAEELRDGSLRVPLFNFKRAEGSHRIVKLFPGRFASSVWSIVLRGRRRRTWGFHTEYGFIPWHVYQTYYHGGLAR